MFFFFNDTATSEIYTLSLHDALPISCRHRYRSAPPTTATAILLPALVKCAPTDRKSTRLNSSHVKISYAVFCLKKKKKHPFTNLFNKSQNLVQHRQRPDDPENLFDVV